MKIISNDSNIWVGLSDLKNAYIEAMVSDEKINPHSIIWDMKAIVGALQGDEEVKNMDLIITERKTNIHDIEISTLKNANKQLYNEINELKKELNSRTTSEDKKEGGDG
jgi:histone deacetylase complex regulatory component SIN3